MAYADLKYSISYRDIDEENGARKQVPTSVPPAQPTVGAIQPSTASGLMMTPPQPKEYGPFKDWAGFTAKPTGVGIPSTTLSGQYLSSSAG